MAKKKQQKMHPLYMTGLSLICLGVVFSTILHQKMGLGAVGLGILILGAVFLVIGIKKSK